MRIITYLFLIFALTGLSSNPPTDTINKGSNLDDNVPDDFVELRSLQPLIHTDVKYASSDNFVGRPIDGYKAAKIFLTRMAADSLHKAVQLLNPLGYGVIIYDGYRPQKAVDMFVRWCTVPGDTTTKNAYYPEITKSRLFDEGYIASKSGHSRGSTVDLGLVYKSTGEVVDMGTPYDFFGIESAPFYHKLSVNHSKKRLILRNAMLLAGFEPLETEWWHFTLRDEPYPDTYFDFDIE